MLALALTFLLSPLPLLSLADNNVTVGDAQIPWPNNPPLWSGTNTVCSNTAHFAYEANMAVSYPFVGTAIYLQILRSSVTGVYTVSIDNNSPTTIDGFHSSGICDTQFGRTGLSNAPHTITVTLVQQSPQDTRPPGGNFYLEVDHFIYTVPSSPASPPPAQPQPPPPPPPPPPSPNSSPNSPPTLSIPSPSSSPSISSNSSSSAITPPLSSSPSSSSPPSSAIPSSHPSSPALSSSSSTSTPPSALPAYIQHKPSLKTATLSGIVIGAIIALLIIALLLFFFLRRRRRRLRNRPANPSPPPGPSAITPFSIPDAESQNLHRQQAQQPPTGTPSSSAPLLAGPSPTRLPPSSDFSTLTGSGKEEGFDFDDLPPDYNSIQ